MTSPFRDLPSVELGPLDVGLEEAAVRAVLQVPRGGRLVASERDTSPNDLFTRALAPSRSSRHALGALGSGIFFAVFVVAVVAARAGWSPSTTADLVGSFALVLVGGLSLGTVLRVSDRGAHLATFSGDEVGRAARRVLLKVARLALLARRSPSSFDASRRAALAHALEALESASLRRWIPDDVRGRMELLLARSTARSAGRALAVDPRVRGEVRRLLGDASRHLVEPAPALADLEAIDHAAPPSIRAFGEAG